MKLIAHRGASADAPENTMAAFELAFKQRADGLEIDIWLTSDHRIAVVHDRDLRRTMRQKKMIDDLTAREAKKLGVPMLCDVLDLLPQGRRIFVEIKCGKEIVPLLKKELADCGGKSQDVMLLGFDPDVMAAARRAYPRQEVWLNIEPGKIGPVPPLIAEAKRRKFTGVSLGFSKKITPHVVSQFREAGLGTTVWVIDDAHTARRMQQWGFDYLMTNRPGALRAIVEREA